MLGIEEDDHLKGVYKQLEGRREREPAKRSEGKWKNRDGRRVEKETPAENTDESGM